MFEPFEARGKSADFIAFPAVRDELPYRLRQQSLLGAFGRSALQTRDLKQILQRAIELCAEGLESPFAKVLEYIPEDNRLLMRAGFGWELGPIDNDIRNALEDASSRVAAIAQVHDQLWRGSRIGFIDLADFMNQLCKQLGNNTDGHVLNCHADTMLVSADHVIPLGLLINELVMNAVKYAYPDGVGGIDVSARLPSRRDFRPWCRPAARVRHRQTANQPRIQGHHGSRKATSGTHCDYQQRAQRRTVLARTANLV